MESSAPWEWGRYRDYLRLRAQLFRIRGRLRARFDASDITQETIEQAFRSRDQFQGQTEAQRMAWLEQIQDRMLIDHWRREHAAKRDVDRECELPTFSNDSGVLLDQQVEALQPSPGEQLSREELRLRVSDAILALPEEQCESLTRVLVLQQSISEAADDMGRTRGSIAGHYARGLAALRATLAAFDPKT